MRFSALIWFITLAVTSTTIYAQPPGIRHYKEPVAAPVFSLPDTEDRIHNLADYQGRVLILNFWATWCIPCRKELPSLKKAWSRLHKEGIQLLGVATRDQREVITEFKHRHGLEFPLPMDQDGSVASNWAVMAVPTAYVIGTDGRIAIRIIGGSYWESSELLDSIIALKQATAKKMATIK